MSSLLENFASLFTWLVTQLGVIASFFTTNDIGKIILGIGVFSIIFSYVIRLINSIHK